MGLFDFLKKKGQKKETLETKKAPKIDTEPQLDLWVVLKDDEYGYVWDKVDKKCRFRAYANPNRGEFPFKFKEPVDYYDIRGPLVFNSDNDESLNEVFKSVFVESMGSDNYMYALDWHHTCFRYNPRINTIIEYPVWIDDNSYGGSGYNVYFPDFYPNGDYYFFIAKDFRWGYLTHPWQMKVWVWGEPLMRLFKEKSRLLGLVPLGKY